MASNSTTIRKPLYAPTSPPILLKRECFVTVGATASFQALVERALSKEFLKTLSDLEYTDLTIQCGPDLSFAESKAEELLGDPNRHRIKIKLFAFNKFGLGTEMRGAKGREAGVMEGVVISHAGAGTILDAMRIDVPIVVVPNPELLDNHQTELAEELQRQGYVTYGHLEDLSAALRTSDEKSKTRTPWEPVNSGADPTGRGILGVMDEELGYEARMREILD